MPACTCNEVELKPSPTASTTNELPGLVLRSRLPSTNLILGSTASPRAIYGEDNLPANVTEAAQETLDAATALLDSKGFDANATLDMDDAKFGDQLRYAVWREQRYGGGEITWSFYAGHGGARQKAKGKAPVRNSTADFESEYADRAEDASPKRWWVWRIRFNCVNTLRRSCWLEIPGSWLVS